MSLITTEYSPPTDEILSINLGNVGHGHGHNDHDKFVTGQTITYSFLNNSFSSIFNKYKQKFDNPSISTDNISLAGNVWTTNPEWQQNAHQAIRAAEEVTRLNFQHTNDVQNSDLRWTPVNDVVQGNSYVLGLSFYTPSLDIDEQDGKDDTGILIYNNNPFHGSTSAIETSNAGLGDGNERTATMVHELGHMLGLSHPFDAAGGSPFAELDDVRYDVMSYNNDEDDRRYFATDLPNGQKQLSPVYNYGAFINYTPINIAQLQFLYGKNNNTNSGNTVYKITDTGTQALDTDGSDGSISIARAYYTIWDTGGTDEIRYDGSARTILNLNAATLKRSGNDSDLIHLLNQVKSAQLYKDMESGFANRTTDSDYYAGGFYSSLLSNDRLVTFKETDGKYLNILGGYAIANDAEIENATGGSGDDLIIGNELNNVLSGGAGNDHFFDGVGNDSITGGNGNDILTISKGNDFFNGGAGADTVIFAGNSNQYDISVSNGTITITDQSVNNQGTNVFENVETFQFADRSIKENNIVPSNAITNYGHAPAVNDAIVSKLGLLNSSNHDTYWGDHNPNNFFSTQDDSLFRGESGFDSLALKGEKIDFTIAIYENGSLKVAKKSDPSKYDLIHSIEKLHFDDQEFLLEDLTKEDLGVTELEFNVWKDAYDFA